MSEWMKDEETGRLYQQFENSRAYAPDMIFSSGYFAHEKPQAKVERRVVRRCPFKSSMSKGCSGDRCAFFDGDCCVLAKLSARKPERNTVGLRCPISKETQPCTEDCALYANGGCVLTTISERGENDGKIQ